MDPMKPAALAAAATSSQRWALCCCLLCMSLLSAGFLAGSRPFLAALRPWEHFSRVQQHVASSSSSSSSSSLPAAPPRAAAAAYYYYHGRDAAVVVAPAATDYARFGDHLDEEDEEGLAPAPAPAPALAGEGGGEEEGEGAGCDDVFDGRWVHDPAGYPLYEAAECPFLSDQVTCRRNGRPDSAYEQWRWQPRGCGGASARFRGTEALEQCRNRRLVFVGDSLNRNMWESLACILYTALPDRSRTRIDDVSSEYKIFRAMDYNCSVEFFWSPFLVKLETKDDRTRALKLDQLPAMLQQVLGADVLVFNTGHWWTHTGKLRAWDHLERNGMLVEMEGEEAFSRALRTWARWVDHHVDPARSRVFFRSISPEHKGANWCYNQTSPITNETIIPWFPESLISIVKRNILSMKTPVTYLNITHLSELRIDAHPSVFTTNRDGKPLTTEQRQQPIVYSDCSHWCLPGLPDTWNVLLLASLMRSPSKVHLIG